MLYLMFLERSWLKIFRGLGCRSFHGSSYRVWGWQCGNGAGFGFSDYWEPLVCSLLGYTAANTHSPRGGPHCSPGVLRQFCVQQLECLCCSSWSRVRIVFLANFSFHDLSWNPWTICIQVSGSWHFCLGWVDQPRWFLLVLTSEPLQSCM